MNQFNRFAGIVAAICFAAFYMAAPASAQASRTWVSGVGDDVNPCSRTAPCKTFAGAISKTATSGEINCLDPGGFGAVTITKSIALVCQFTEGGITNPSTNGITINASGATVFLSGLDIEGIGQGVNGVNVISVGTLRVANCIIRGNNTAGATSGYGINFTPDGAANLFVADTLIADNGAGSGGSSTGAGILIKPTSGGSAVAMLERVRLENNTNGISVNTTNAGAGISSAVVSDSVISGGAVGVATSASGTQAIITVKRSLVQNASIYGIAAAGSGSQSIYSDSVVTKNGTGVFASSGNTISYTDNILAGNSTNGTPTVTTTKN